MSSESTLDEEQEPGRREGGSSRLESSRRHYITDTSTAAAAAFPIYEWRMNENQKKTCVQCKQQQQQHRISSCVQSGGER